MEECGLYILKNAIRGIIRSPGRTLIIVLIVIAISAASCVALSIQQSAQTARVNSSNSLTIRGHIKADRKYVMETLQAANESGAETGESESVDSALKTISGLELSEMQTYAEAPSVRDFYYYATVSLSGDNGLQALNQDDHSEVEGAISDMLSSGPGGGQGRGRGGPGGGGGGQSVKDIMASINFGGDFILYGYSSDTAMEAFQDGTCYMTSGAMFTQGTTEYECILDEELATYNNLKVGDQISLSNPAATSERFLLMVTGIYKNTADASAGSQGGDDPANHILTSYAVVHDIVEKSKSYQNPAAVESILTLEDGTKVEQLLTDEGTLVIKGQQSADGAAVTAAAETAGTSDGEAAEAKDASGAETDGEEEESDIALQETVVGTYLFGSIEDFDAFEAEAHERGLSENYTVTSSDVAAYEASLVPLDNLSSYANTFLYIVLGIGAVILVGVNVFNIRERKYEIGALTAMGMRKGKVAVQFILELTIVTFLGILLGSALGGAASTPIANRLLASQIAYEQSNSDQVNENFGRQASGTSAKPHGGDVEGEVEYVSTVSFSFNYELICRMMLIGALLAFVSSTGAIAFVLRYDPLEILAERD